MERIKVILNPYSGRGRGGRIETRIVQAFSQAGLQCDVASTRGAGHAIELAEQARREGYATVVAAGGDGTVSEVMNGLAQATPADQVIGRLGVLPIGSGNDFAAMVGCRLDLDQAIGAIVAGRSRRIDLGRAQISEGDTTTTRYFDNNMGLGLEARVTIESYRIKRLQGTLLYVTAALRTLRNYVSPHMDVSCETEDGMLWQRSGQTLLVTIGNSRRTGGGFYLTPDAVMDDGILDVGVAKAAPAWRVLVLLPKALLGKHTNDPVITMLRCRSIRVACSQGCPVQLDGEVVARAAREISVTIHPGRLEVIV